MPKRENMRYNPERHRDYRGSYDFITKSYNNIKDLAAHGWKREVFDRLIAQTRGIKSIVENNHFILLVRSQNLQNLKKNSSEEIVRLLFEGQKSNLTISEPLIYQGFGGGTSIPMGVPIGGNVPFVRCDAIPELSGFSNPDLFPTLDIIRRDLPDSLCVAYDSEWYLSPSGSDIVISHQFSFIDALRGDLVTMVFLPLTGFPLALEAAIGRILGYLGCYTSLYGEQYYLYDACGAWDEVDDKPIISTFNTSWDVRNSGKMVYIWDQSLRRFAKKRIKDMPLDEQASSYLYRNWSYYHLRESPAVKENRVNITLISHFGRADGRNLGNDDGYKLLRYCSSIQGGTVTLSCPVKIDAWDCLGTTLNGYKFFPVSLSIRDTMCHAPVGGKSLDILGKSIGFEKISIPQKDKEAMGDFLQRDPAGCIEYAARDSEVTVLYAASIYGANKRPPVTGTGAAAKYCLKKQAECFGLVKEGKIDMIEYNRQARGLMKVKKGKIPSENRAGFIDASNLEPINFEADKVQTAASHAYHGGINCCTMPGLYNGVTTYDVDLQNAYPSPMVLIPDIDWENPIRETITERELTMQKFVDSATGIISPMPLFIGYCRFEHPKEVKYPCLPVNVEGSLLFPRKTAEDSDGCYLAGPEIVLALKMGTKIYCKEGYFLNPLMRPDPENPNRMIQSYSLRDVVLALVRDRATAKKIFGKKSMEQDYLKLLVNALYGKIAQNVVDKSAWDIHCQAMKEIGASHITNPVTACLITSTVRAMLLAAMNQVQQSGYLWMSTTTDGGITTAPIDVVDGLDLYGLRDYLGYGREILTDGQSRALWEIKHAQDDLLNLTRRGNVSLYTADNPYHAPNGQDYPGVCARNGWKSTDKNQQKGSIEDRREFRTLCLTRIDRVLADKSSFTSLKEMTYPDPAMRKPFRWNPATTNLRMDYEFSRKPIRESFTFPTENVDGVDYEVATFDTAPFEDANEYLNYRQKMACSPCLRTRNDWKLYWRKLECNVAGTGAKPRNMPFARVFSCVMGWRQKRFDIPFLDSHAYSLDDKIEILNTFCEPARTFKRSDWKISRSPARQANMLPYEEIAEVLEKLQAVPADPDVGRVVENADA